MSGMDKAKNNAQKLGGKAKEAVGKVTGDKSTENEGKGDQAKANLKYAGEKVKRRVLVHSCCRLGRTANPPPRFWLSFTDWLRPGRSS